MLGLSRQLQKNLSSSIHTTISTHLERGVTTICPTTCFTVTTQGGKAGLPHAYTLCEHADSTRHYTPDMRSAVDRRA